MPVPLEQSGGGAGGTTLTGTGIARNTGACTELSGAVTTSGSNATTLAPVAPSKLQNCDVATGTGITFKRAATAQNTGSAPRTTVTIAVNPGETVVVLANVGTATINTATPEVMDDGANGYTYTLTANATSGCTYVFVGLNVRKTVSKITVSNPAGLGVTTVVAAVYGGVGSLGATNTSNNTLTISLTTTANNSFVVAGITYFQTGSVITQSGVTTGNGRANQPSTISPANTVGISLVDNTAVSSGTNVTNTVTTNGAPNDANVAIELIPF